MRAKGLVSILVGSLGGGLLLAWLDGKGFSLAGATAYAFLLAASLAVVVWVHRSMPSRGPAIVVALAVGAMGLRLAVGVGLARALPVLGYQTSAEIKGYVLWDAYKRDTDAWQRARGELPLLAAFTDPKGSDQYGGLLYISASVYRYLGGEVHRPLMVVVLTAAASALGGLFIWAFADLALGSAPGVVAAWIAALVPESILLGASQMREPFLIMGLAMSLFGYALSRQEHRSRGVPWILAGLLLLLLLSPPTALGGAIVLGAAVLWEGGARLRVSRWVWWLGVPVALASLFLVIRSWARLEEISGTLGQILVQWWQNAGAPWRVGQAAANSDMLEVLLYRLPPAAHLPFLVAYGIVQPFLPAAIAAPGNPLWKAIAILRGLGWFALVPPMIYGTIAAIQKRGWRSLGAYLGILVWVTALLASYRAPGYQWDNPRYRAVFLVAQASLAAWAWVTARSDGDPWLRRTYVSLGLATLLVLDWYLGRYAGFPSLGLEATLLAVAAAVVGYVTLCILNDRRARRSRWGASGPVGRTDHV